MAEDDAGRDDEAAGSTNSGVVTVADRFLAAGVSREVFEAHLVARRIAVAGERISDAGTAVSPTAAVAVMLDPI